jgi:hypothetical protein
MSSTTQVGRKTRASRRSMTPGEACDQDHEKKALSRTVPAPKYDGSLLFIAVSFPLGLVLACLFGMQRHLIIRCAMMVLVIYN